MSIEDDHAEEDEHHEEELAEQFTFEVKGLKAGETSAKLPTFARRPS